MKKDEYDFEAELAQSVSAIVEEDEDLVDLSKIENSSSYTKKITKSLKTSSKGFYGNDDDDDDDDDELIEHKHRKDDFNKYSKNGSNRSSNRTYNKNTNNSGNNYKYTYIAIAALVFITIATVSIIISTAVGKYKEDKAKDSYEYNIDKAVRAYAILEYDKALEYFEKSLNYYNEVDNVNVRYYMYMCEKQLGNESASIEWLSDILKYDSYNKMAISKMAEYYSRVGNYDKLNQLISKYKDTEAGSAVESYVNSMPGVSHCPGIYNTSIEIMLFSNLGYDVHYTLDGTNPNAKDELYTEPVKIGKGTTVLKAVAVDGSGVLSDVLECKYVVNYAVPDSPVIRPGAGDYTTAQLITIDNYVDDGNYTTYYSLDGSIPGKGSKIYSGPIEMPSGNIIFSAATVSKDGISSSVIKRNYNLKLAAMFSYDDALGMLQKKLIENGVLNGDATALASGEAVKFVYYKKQYIGNNEMYLVYFDIRNESGYERQGYLYGIDTVTGICYKVTEASGELKSEAL